MNKQKEKKAKIFNKSVSDILVTQNMRRSKDKENLLKLFLPWTFQKISHACRCQTSWSFYGYQLPPPSIYCYTNPNTFNLLDVFSATLSSAAQSLPPFPNIKDVNNKYFTHKRGDIYLTWARQWCINHTWNLFWFGTYKVWKFKHIFNLNTLYASTKIQCMEYLVSISLPKHVSYSFPCPFRPAEWPAARKADPYAHNPETQSRVYLKSLSLSVCPSALLLLLGLPLCTSSDWKVYRLIHHQSWHCVKWASVQSKSKLLRCFIACVASVSWMILDPYQPPCFICM